MNSKCPFTPSSLQTEPLMSTVKQANGETEWSFSLIEATPVL